MKTAATFEERMQAHEWITSHPVELEQHIGKWIAVGKGGIAATASSLPQLKKRIAPLKAAVVLLQVPNPAVAYVL